MALAVFIVIYSIIGAFVLYLHGRFFFLAQEATIYAVISGLVCFTAFLTFVGINKQSMFMTRLMTYCWPIVLVTVVVRAIVMLFRLHRNMETISDSCGQIHANSTSLVNTTENANGTLTTAFIPSVYCSMGSNTLFLAFAVAVALDLALQVYQWFLAWRFTQRLVHNYERIQKQMSRTFTA